MDNGKVMGRRQFFSRFFPMITESIAEKTKDEIKIATSSSGTEKMDSLNKAEVAEGVEENSVRKYPWVGM